MAWRCGHGRAGWGQRQKEVQPARRLGAAHVPEAGMCSRQPVSRATRPDGTGVTPNALPRTRLDQSEQQQCWTAPQDRGQHSSPTQCFVEAPCAHPPYGRVAPGQRLGLQAEVSFVSEPKRGTVHGHHAQGKWFVPAFSVFLQLPVLLIVCAQNLRPGARVTCCRQHTVLDNLQLLTRKWHQRSGLSSRYNGIVVSQA